MTNLLKLAVYVLASALVVVFAVLSALRKI
jgi:hypothetical protein